MSNVYVISCMYGEYESWDHVILGVRRTLETAQSDAQIVLMDGDRIYNKKVVSVNWYGEWDNWQPGHWDLCCTVATTPEWIGSGEVTIMIQELELPDGVS